MACNEKNPLQRDGSSQSQRLLKALDPANAPVQELDLREWMLFAAKYAEKINYYSIKDSVHPRGDWRPFFIQDEKELDQFLEEVELKIKNANDDFSDDNVKSDVEPHLALFMCFLTLLRHSKDSLNEITGRHLDFYFKKVLQLRNRDEVPDKVHVIFELARNASDHTLPEGAMLDAGKDNSTKPKQRAYAVNSELVVNSASIAAMKSICRSTKEDNSRQVQYADVTFSADGLGTPIKEDVPKWNAFGNSAWPVASLGFAFASKVLLLSEGDRTIKLTLTFSNALKALSAVDLSSLFVVFFTSEKEWIQGEFPVSGAFELGQSDTQLTITVNLPVKSAAVVPYDQSVHKENYQTDLPVMRMLMKTEGVAFDVYEALAGTSLAKVQIDVDVKGLKNLSVENDNGKLDPSKPFFAFGPQPKVGSNLYIGSSEIFQKDWTEITPAIQWKNLPDDMAKHYNCYRKNYVNGTLSQSVYDINSSNENAAGTGGGRIIAGEGSFTADATYLRDGAWYPTDSAGKEIELLDGSFKLTPQGVKQPYNPSAFIYQYLYFNTNISIASNYYSQSQKAIVQNTLNKGQNELTYLGFSGFAGLNSGVKTQTENYSSGAKDNYIRITLTQDFMHDIYPQLFAVAMSKMGFGALIPKQPYTPEIASLTIDYKATAKNDVSVLRSSASDEQLNDYISRNIQFFHETPFGQAEQHIFLKSKYPASVADTIYGMPVIPALSGFYIGIDGIGPGSVASILFQVSEGSEDPTKPSFTETLQPVWYYLSGNEWIALDKQYIIYDDTNDFLRSGIIRFMIPDGAVTTNTFLNQELIWLGVELPSELSADSACKFINVHIQAAEAEFADQDNDLSHLKDGIPENTISKLVNRLPQIKSVSQPYASFGGSLPESDEDFRLRVSERLRHKNRGITIWDFEHLVMARFSQIHRVKCLNHTKYADAPEEYCEVAPGHVTIVCIPDIRNQNSFDPFEPRVSKNTLSEIRTCLLELTDLHTDLQVINPKYEEVTFEFKVKFYAGYDNNQYKIQLNTDLVNYLSPWAYSSDAEIDFGGTLYKSVVIRFIEELRYVDYISNFKMYFTGSVSDPDVLQVSESRAILVSAKEHNIDTQNIPVCP